MAPIMETYECVDGSTMEVLPVGAIIRHVKKTHLRGYIKRHEFHHSGKLSPIPYSIGWDNPGFAARELGFMFVYACVDRVEEVGEWKIFDAAVAGE